jgi:predicted nucleic acid-binding protein
MKVVIDTNVLVSALLKTNGSEAGVLFAVDDKRLIWCVSPAILHEYAAVQTIFGNNVNRDELSLVGQAARPISANLRGPCAAKDPALSGSFPHSDLDTDGQFYG